MTEDVRHRARAGGIALDYEDARGKTVCISDEVLSDLLAAMGGGRERQHGQDARLPAVLVVTPVGGAVSVALPDLGAGIELEWLLNLEDGQSRTGRSCLDDMSRLVLSDVPLGYHMLVAPELDASCALVVTPGKCWLPDTLPDEKRRFGISLQLYLMRSKRNFGVGDFGDLARFAALAAQRGCDVIGVNPLHQMFLDAPEQASPYSPVSRYFLNILYIDLQALPEWSSAPVQSVISSPEFLSALKQCREAPLVDYNAATTLKLSVLRAAYSAFQSDSDPVRRAELDSFVASGGDRLRLASLFQVMRARWSGEEREHDRGWLGRCPYASSEAVAQFAEQHREEVAFLTWMQWVADVHLRMAAKACAESGMSIGIYRDLAVGCDRSGAETWSEPLSFIQGVSVGAPPDILNPAGQNWGLPPFNPVMLRRQGYRPLRDLIRANMRHAGGLRIDHVMGLQRLYCIPDGRSASEGAYIEYPLDDMLGIIALESHRNQCIVVGEDLGTVPAGFRERLEAANVLSYRVLMFEQDADGFILPENYPEKADAVAGSHDMATLTGWHAGTDIALKAQLGLYPDAGEVTRQRRQRESERRALEQLLFGKTARPTAAEFSDAIHRFLGRTRAFLAIAQLDDLIAEAEPVNVPGTVDHPNWRRRYNQPLEALSDDHRAWQQLGAFRPSTA